MPMMPMVVLLPLHKRDPFNPSTYDGRTIRNGLVAMGLMALVSVVTTLFLLIFMLNRMLRWKSYYKENLWHNQYIVLIICLLVADLVQSLAFAFSFYWLTSGAVGGPVNKPTGACFAQGFIVHFGDVGSAFFVLAVAAHTCFQVGFSRRLSDKPFFWGVGLTAILSLILTIIPPAAYGTGVYVDTEAWVSRAFLSRAVAKWAKYRHPGRRLNLSILIQCWIAEEHENMRLGTHYIWIFLIQGLCIILYGALFWKLSVARKTIGSMNKTVNTNDQRFKRAALLMAIYPIVYVGLTLPLAASRMALYAHRSVPEWAWVFAGTLMTSSGWVDCVLYAVTRRALLKEEFKSSSGHSRHSYGEGTNWLRRHHSDKHDSTDMFGASIRKSFYTSTEKVNASVVTRNVRNDSTRGRMSDRSNDSATAVDPHSPPRSQSQVRLKHNSADIELGTFYRSTAGDGEDPENGSMSSESPIILQRSNSKGSKAAVARMRLLRAIPKELTSSEIPFVQFLRHNLLRVSPCLGEIHHQPTEPGYQIVLTRMRLHPLRAVSTNPAALVFGLLVASQSTQKSTSNLGLRAKSQTSAIRTRTSRAAHGQSCLEDRLLGITMALPNAVIHSKSGESLVPSVTSRQSPFACSVFGKRRQEQHTYTTQTYLIAPHDTQLDLSRSNEEQVY
ncbi:uncharacterized protein BDR25DRAFT_390573 [Lindgomyces ingoldianus]|uniref:Uncharacterized protein n=1 Tax=Lindgomyces ingoldianus TaxID=673940 RepID=A0ACB6RGE7_9PLEO|nr:uncharacterized protein BDR25DRAFT_390573 [Lindgomyces ingoldianus]KAF2478398.1 hypothetical protein BDR25DRAFT_390573 [Lindgomyces ingoldianus]